MSKPNNSAPAKKDSELCPRESRIKKVSLSFKRQLSEQ